MIAKLINGIPEYFQQPDWLSGDATAYATEQGYKEVIYQEGNNGTYETVNNIVIETPAPVILPITVLTKYQFMNRLTVPERIAIFELESSNSMVKMWLEMFKIADEIDVTNAETIAGVNMLSQLGVITSDRITEILKS